MNRKESDQKQARRECRHALYLLRRNVEKTAKRLEELRYQIEAHQLDDPTIEEQLDDLMGLSYGAEFLSEEVYHRLEEALD